MADHDAGISTGSISSATKNNQPTPTNQPQPTNPNHHPPNNMQWETRLIFKNW